MTTRFGWDILITEAAHSYKKNSIAVFTSEPPIEYLTTFISLAPSFYTMQQL